jgi:hypothetical protein
MGSVCESVSMYDLSHVSIFHPIKRLLIRIDSFLDNEHICPEDNHILLPTYNIIKKNIGTKTEEWAELRCPECKRYGEVRIS